MTHPGNQEYAPTPKSDMPGIVWPAVPGSAAASTFSVLAQLELSQWWSQDALLRHQLRQATEIVSFAAQNVPFYRNRLAPFANPSRALTLQQLQTISLLRRSDLQRAGDALLPEKPPNGHGQNFDVSTSGSTGEPVVVKWNGVMGRIQSAFVLRSHLWHRRDFRGKVAVIRRLTDDVVENAKKATSAHWSTEYRSGSIVFFDIGGSVDDALDWIAREEPDYLSIYPTYLRAMIDVGEAKGFRPAKLKQIETFSEVLDPNLRQRCAEVWNVPIVDRYAAQETGFLGLQCPECDRYHVQSEFNLIEILDEDGQQCGPGEIGRVVVTSLHNFATPLIRYDLGDFALVGEPCRCGRGLPVLDAIYGRARNMFRAPDGSRFGVTPGRCRFEEITPIRQVQLVQKSLAAVELKFVASRSLTEEEEARARESVYRVVPRTFSVTLNRVEAIPRSSGGKYEDVISEVVD